MKRGYDGVMAYGDKGTLRQIAVFHPTQIKSAIGNSGNWNPKDARITASASSRQPADKRTAGAAAAGHSSGRRPAAELRASANPYGDTGCPICGEHAVSSCRCGGPHDEAALKKGHGLKCPNGHNWSKGLAYDPATKKFKSDGTRHQPTGETFEDDIIARRAVSAHPLEAAAGPLPGQIERVIVSLQNDGRLPIRIPPETMRHVAESLARYFQTASADKIEQFAEAAKAAVEAELKTVNVQTHDTMKADTTGVNVGSTPATSRGALTDFIESATGDNIGGLMNMDFFNRIMREVTQGAGNFVAQNFDQTRLDEFPALELHRVYDREVPRGFKVGKGGAIVPDPDNDWPSRWEAAGGELVDGRMVALKSDPIWQALGDGEGGYEDTLGNPFAPFAFNSGYDADEVSREDAVALGLMDDEDQAQPADFDFRQLLDIEAASAASCGALQAGAEEGHPFYGNQYTAGSGQIWHHGTPSIEGGVIKPNSAGVVHFAASPKSAAFHAGKEGVVLQARPVFKNPRIVKVQHYDTLTGDPKYIAAAKRLGYDSFMTQDGKVLAVFKNQKVVGAMRHVDAMNASFQNPLEAAAGDVPLVAKCFITDADGRLLVLQADGYGRMDLPGGHLRAGETVEDGLRREVLEETGMTLTDVKELGTVLVPWNGQQPIVFFSAQSDDDEAPVLSDEHVAWKWLTRHQVPLENFSALNKVVNNFTDGKDLNEA